MKTVTPLEILAKEYDECARRCGGNGGGSEFWYVLWTIPGEGIEHELNVQNARGCIDHVRSMFSLAPAGTTVQVYRGKDKEGTLVFRKGFTKETPQGVTR